MVDAWIDLLLQADGPLKRLRATWPTLVNDEFRESAQGRAAFDAWARVLATVQGASLCHIAKGMTQFDLRGRLAAIRAPALVISGENDRLFSPDHGREISDQIAGSRCSVISGAGHLSSLDSSDQSTGCFWISWRPTATTEFTRRSMGVDKKLGHASDSRAVAGEANYRAKFKSAILNL